MTFLKSLIPGLLMLVLFTQCEQQEPITITPPVDFSCEDQPNACTLAANNGHFAIDLLKQLNEENPSDENLLFSPFSISTALSMTMNGANGETLTEMQEALRTGELNLQELNEAYQILLEVLPKLDPKTKVKLANSIWHLPDYPVKASFLNTNQVYFNSDVIPHNLRAEGALDIVNEWIEDNTEGLIPDALNTLPNNVVMLLINTIYFNGPWRTEFDPENTVAATFESPTGSEDVELMHIEESAFRYTENALFQAIDLPYGDSVFSMSVFLPNQNNTVDEIIAELTPENWASWQDQMSNNNVEVFLPKFEFKFKTKLKPTLAALGMEQAFDQRADFTEMIEGGGVKIDDVIHEAVIKVSEEGTEAAAVTVVVVVETSVPLVPTFKVDRPFLFVIHDNKTGSMLFLGKVMSIAG